LLAGGIVDGALAASGRFWMGCTAAGQPDLVRRRVSDEITVCFSTASESPRVLCSRPSLRTKARAPAESLARSMEDGEAPISRILAFREEMAIASSPPFMLAASFCGVLFVAHLVTAAFIAWKDLTGSWSKFALCKTDARADRWKCYVQGFLNFIKDVGLILLPGLSWYINGSAHKPVKMSLHV